MTRPDPVPTVGGIYTMAEAARIKGVSYSTVSRAVRAGKLPVHRLGRMAMIAAAALEAWQPMVQKAPYTNRRRQPDPTAVPVMMDRAVGAWAETALRLDAIDTAVAALTAELAQVRAELAALRAAMGHAEGER